MKKIIFDARWIRNINLDGIGNFTLNTLKYLIKIEKEAQINTKIELLYFIIIQNKEIESFIKKEFPEIKNLFIIENDINSLKAILKINNLIFKVKPDIFFSPCYSFLEFFLIKTYKIAVVHDLIPIIFPNSFINASFKFKLFYCNKIIQRFFINASNKIVAVSNSTKNDLNKYLNINLSKISVIMEGFDKNIQKDDYNYLNDKYALKNNFFLFVGRHEEYKNIDKLIYIYSKLSYEIKNNYKLIIIGKEKEITTKLKKLVEDLKEENHIIFFSNIIFEDLIGFYQKAKILLHFSKYEGFGLTLLESMSQGTPVIANNTSSIPEVIGEAGILVNVENEIEIVNSIEKLLKDTNYYDLLVKKSIKQANLFNWENTAKSFRELFIKNTS
ncbi:MAG: glycosyltransferase family 1 protein [Candidatus Sericytochromatia bacterium]